MGYEFPTNKKDSIVGAVRKPDGTWDYSHAATFETTKQEPLAETHQSNATQIVWEQSEQLNFLRTLSSGTAIGKERSLKFKAKEKGASVEEVLRTMREYAKSKIHFPEKVTYFHRTGMENFQSIVEMGSLLSRSEIKKRKPDFEMPAWSASDDVMMTQDVFDSKGDLIIKGLSEHGVGASGGDITFVIDPQVMTIENFDAIGQYPTVSDAPLDKICKIVLVEKAENIKPVEKILANNNLKDIAVRLKQGWLKEHYK